MRKFIAALLIFLNCAALSACGVKPGAVDPPPGAEDSRFPHTYPNPKTDPKP